MIWVLLTALSFYSWAPAAEILTWQKCIDIVRQNNSDLKAARSSLEASGDQENSSYGGFFPQIAGSLGYNKTSLGSQGEYATTTSGYTAALTGSENLFKGFRDVGNIRSNAALKTSAEANLRLTKAKVSFDLKSAFEDLRYADDSVKLTQSFIERRRANLKLVQLRFQGGRENRGSVLLSKAYLNQATLDDLQARQARRVALAQMAAVLGRDQYDDFDVSDSVPTIEPSGQTPNFKSLAVHTPDFEQAVAREQGASAQITIARSQFFPSLDLTSTLARTGTEFFSQDANRFTVGAALTIPLFNGGRDYYATSAASANWEAAAATRDSVSRQLLTTLEQAFSGYEQAVEKLKVDISFREAATERSQIARAQYNNGLLSFNDWDLIENDLINREKAYLQSLRDRVISEAAWEQAQGKGAIP